MTISGSQLPSPGPVTEDALSNCGVGSSGVRVGTGWTLVGTGGRSVWGERDLLAAATCVLLG